MCCWRVALAAAASTSFGVVVIVSFLFLQSEMTRLAFVVTVFACCATLTAVSLIVLYLHGGPRGGETTSPASPGWTPLPRPRRANALRAPRTVHSLIRFPGVAGGGWGSTEGWRVSCNPAYGRLPPRESPSTSASDGAGPTSALRPLPPLPTPPPLSPPPSTAPCQLAYSVVPLPSPPRLFTDASVVGARPAADDDDDDDDDDDEDLFCYHEYQTIDETSFVEALA